MFILKNNENESIIFSSWSGGKDSALAFFKGRELLGRVDYIFTMFDESGLRTRAHGLSIDVLKLQAESLGVKLITANASWEEYEEIFKKVLEEHFAGGIGIFGDIDLQEHLDWVVKVCSEKRVDVLEPLWKKNRGEIFEEFIRLGFKARVISTKTGFEELIGKEINKDFIKLVENLGIDICGENGEYHTLVYDGPTFGFPLPIDKIMQKHIKHMA
ncbi:MAG: diphthine--ammonia ligase [Fervidobacterium sp.]